MSIQFLQELAYRPQWYSFGQSNLVGLTVNDLLVKAKTNNKLEYNVVAGIDRQPAPVGKGDCPGCCDIVTDQKYFFAGRMVEFRQQCAIINGAPFTFPSYIDCNFETIRQLILDAPSTFELFHEMEIVTIYRDRHGGTFQYFNLEHKPDPRWSYVMSSLLSLGETVPFGSAATVL